jgi:hypothetical protein
VWENNLKERFTSLFHQRCIEHNGGKRIPVAQFISSLYDLNVIDKLIWPTSKILEDMHQRGYARDVFTKPSYGAEPPPPLTLDDSLSWMAYFRVRSLNSR